MNAYEVVGPTNAHPRRRRSLLIAIDSGLVDCLDNVAQSSCLGRAFGSGSNPQTYAARLPYSPTSSMQRRALLMVASIFARLRTIPESAMSRCTLRTLNRATNSISNDLNARRK